MAFGGNALLDRTSGGSFAEQRANAEPMVRAVRQLVASGDQVVLTHGNGPQVGNLALQQEEAAHRVAPQPLPVLGAMTQGQIGHLLALGLQEDETPIEVTTLVSHVLVDEADPAFNHPTKPIGPFFPEDEPHRPRERDWQIAQVNGGYRRIVPSPQPVELLEVVMGPDAGTASLSGTSLGFANVVLRGPVGVVAAAGTGAQEVMTLLDRWGAGVSHVIGLGGRDLSGDVGGIMALQAIAALEQDDGTDVILLVSKPPAPDVAHAILNRLAQSSHPAVVAFLGLEPSEQLDSSSGVTVSRSLEASVLATLDRLQLPGAEPSKGLGQVAAQAIQELPEGRRALRGLFSGGTICYETLALASQWLGPVYSNTPLRADWSLPGPDDGHVCLDLGEEEYTKGRPHPMIDPDARVEHLLSAADDPATAVILLDVVLGYSSHDDPASVLGPVCARIRERPDPPAVVAYVLGSDDDPQDRNTQRKQLETAGCLLAPTASRAALLAAAIAARQSGIAEEPV